MLQRIKEWFAQLGLHVSDIQIKPLAEPLPVEDQKSVETRKRLDKLFEQQQTEMQARALVPHDIDCKDPFFCTKNPCFKWQPDKIIRTYTVNQNLVEIPVDSEDKK